MYRGWRFFATALDNAQLSLGTADMPTARRYALPWQGRRRGRYVRGASRRNTTGACRRAAGHRQGELLEHAPVLARSIKLRNPYVDALHLAQIALLRRYRALPADTSAGRARPRCSTQSITASTASPPACKPQAELGSAECGIVVRDQGSVDEPQRGRGIMRARMVGACAHYPPARSTLCHSERSEEFRTNGASLGRRFTREICPPRVQNGQYFRSTSPLCRWGSRSETGICAKVGRSTHFQAIFELPVGDFRPF